ncbi:hypothetical protein TNCV_3671471 [Trichonephila clavipes]|nr:hypothetical protein TNCV_3671471 [Trichonephila clavipes]
MRLQRRVRTEWNVDPTTSKSMHHWERTLNETGTLVFQTAKGEVAKQFSECHRRTTVLQVASNDDQRGPSVKRNGTPDNNSWLRFCVVRNRESRIGTLPLASPEMFSMIVRT